MDDIHVDLTELIARPLRTGIQRVEREALRHWPGPARLLPCRIDATGRLMRLSDGVLDLLCEADDGTTTARQVAERRLHDLAAQAKPVREETVRQLLNLELFHDATRADAHLRMCTAGVRVAWFIYDFIPYLRPELFPQGTVRHCMHYLRALQAVPKLAFLSEQTRSEFITRIARDAAAEGPVVMLGADGLGLERQRFHPGRQHIVAIGTIESRKNPIALLEAFEQLWQRGVDVPLVVAGHVSEDAADFLAWVRQHRGDPRLTLLERPSDDTLRGVLRQARAVVMASEVEGFGLPPYEAVHAGIPAIASAALPSVRLLPAGVLKLRVMTAAAIATAVEFLQDDVAAEHLWREAAGVVLPGWRDFGRSLAAWVQEDRSTMA